MRHRSLFLDDNFLCCDGFFFENQAGRPLAGYQSRMTRPAFSLRIIEDATGRTIPQHSFPVGNFIVADRGSAFRVIVRNDSHEMVEAKLVIDGAATGLPLQIGCLQLRRLSSRFLFKTQNDGVETLHANIPEIM